MDYQIGSIGRIVIAKFEDGEDLIGNLTDLAKIENIRHAFFYLIGGMKGGRLVVGPEKDELPPTPMWRELTESHEMLGFGTIFWQDDEPKVHLHGAFGKKDTVKVGCLRENSEVFLVLEAIIMELVGANAIRELDPASGMSLLKLIYS